MMITFASANTEDSRSINQLNQNIFLTSKDYMTREYIMQIPSVSDNGSVMSGCFFQQPVDFDAYIQNKKYIQFTINHCN